MDSRLHVFTVTMLEHWGILSPRLLETELLTLPSNVLDRDLSCPSSGKWIYPPLPFSPTHLKPKILFCKGIKLTFLTCNPLALQAEQTDLSDYAATSLNSAQLTSLQGDLCTREYESQHWVIHMALFNYAWHYKEGKLTFPPFLT